MSEKQYRIRNWEKFQHFKDRRPPWIKLYREILEDPDWHELDGNTAKGLIGLWLLASEDAQNLGTLPDERKIMFRLRMKGPEVKNLINRASQWLVQHDDNVISTCHHDGPPETETETETEVEREAETVSPVGGCAAKIATREIPLYWNEQAAKSTTKPGLIKIRCKEGVNPTLSPELADRFAAAAKKNPAVLDLWRDAIQGLAHSPHHCGKNDREWRAGVDFLLQPGKIVIWADKFAAMGDSAWERASDTEGF